MRRAARFAAGAGIGVTLLAIGCGGEELAGPPELRPGRDECAECGMLVHDERAASALLVEQRGRRAHLLFDDIGCMVDHEAEHGAALGVVDRYVHDHTTKAWIPSHAAAFLLTDSDSLHTPMGSGIAAFAGASAEEAQRRFGGEVAGYAALGPARRARLEARFPDGPGGP
ncbi:MAG TPA: nitrous oxide reductase accessory protein NosL [Phycisphaerales bacterium]|nr:nitrous oxide reductase accessory protein NosL [Phycisphaerales bacterium]